MKTIQAILALIVATLFVTAVGFAGEETEIKQRVKLKIHHGGELVAIDAENMEVGETRQSYTESGKEVLFTRTEDGYQLEVDGEEIELGMFHGEDHHAMVHATGGKDAKVIVRKFRHGEDCEHAEDCEHGEHGYAFIHADKDHHWVQKGEGGEDIHIQIERTDPAEHLLQSGVLDDLDEATRQKILDTLREMSPERIEKRIVVEIDEEVEEKVEKEDE